VALATSSSSGGTSRGGLRSPGTHRLRAGFASLPSRAERERRMRVGLGLPGLIRMAVLLALWLGLLLRG